MEAVVSLPNLKSRNLLIGDDDGGSFKDMISNLPDNILLHILSFLPIKDVLKTSVLSTRWKYLWTSVSDIDFDQTTHNLGLDMRNSFLDSVERWLSFHDTSYIRKFRLVLCMKVCASHVSSWVSSAISHKVQELDLSLPVEAHFAFPDSLFTSDSLRVLKLDMDILLKVPSSIRFLSLKTLHLTVTFQCDRSAEQLFSGCQVLEELVLNNCVWRHTKRITISIPTLKTLIISGHPYSPDYLLDCVITIYAENLFSLECVRCLSMEIFLCNLSSLTYAYIDATTLGLREEQFPKRAMKLLNGIHNVKFLTLSVDTLECLSFEENLEENLPIFRNLTHFKVNPMGGYTINQVLMHFLQKSPNVESVEIPQAFHPEIEILLHILPQCFTSLKNVSTYFKGREEEILFINYLLDNANTLERITIFCPSYLVANLEKMKKIKKKLKAESRSCAIEFV